MKFGPFGVTLTQSIKKKLFGITSYRATIFIMSLRRFQELFRKHRSLCPAGLTDDYKTNCVDSNGHNITIGDLKKYLYLNLIIFGLLMVLEGREDK